VAPLLTLAYAESVPLSERAALRALQASRGARMEALRSAATLLDSNADQLRAELVKSRTIEREVLRLRGRWTLGARSAAGPMAVNYTFDHRMAGATP